MSSKRGGRGGGRGGGGGGGGGGGMPREKQVSKKISWLLRHGAEKEGLKLGSGGYVGVKDALNTHALRSLKITFEELKDIVATNDKQRFSLIPMTAATKVESSSTAEAAAETATQDIPPSSEQTTLPADFDTTDPSNYLIRANQGHTLKVDTEGLLTPITSTNIPRIVVHGTDERSFNLILKSGGLRPMGRNHIHFALGLPKGWKHVSDSVEESSVAPQDDHHEEQENTDVISGMRNSSTHLIYIDVEAAMEEGIRFWISENGVVLSEGGEGGCLGYRFFKRVVDRRGEGRVVMRDGVLPEGVVVDEVEWKKEVGAGRRGGRGRGGGGGSGRGGGGGRGRGKGNQKAKVVDDERDLLVDV